MPMDSLMLNPAESQNEILGMYTLKNKFILI